MDKTEFNYLFFLQANSRFLHLNKFMATGVIIRCKRFENTKRWENRGVAR